MTSLTIQQRSDQLQSVELPTPRKEKGFSDLYTAWGIDLSEPGPQYRAPDRAIIPYLNGKNIRHLDPGNYLRAIEDLDSEKTRTKVMESVSTHFGGEIGDRLRAMDPESVHLSNLFQRIKDISLCLAWPPIRARLPKNGTHRPPLDADARTIRSWMRDPRNGDMLRAITVLPLAGLDLMCIPEELGLLTSLQHIDMAQNRIRALDPALFRNLTQLKLLSLRKNQIRYVPANLFRYCPIEKVDFSENQILTIHPDAFRGCSKLVFVAFIQNQLISLPPTLFRDCVALSDAEFGNNRITSIPKELFSRASRIIIMDFYKNRIGEYPEVKLPRRIKRSELDGNPLSLPGELAALYHWAFKHCI